MRLQEILDDIRSDRVKKVILDTDTYNEVDDQYALACCYLSPKIQLAAVHAAPFHNERSDSFADGMEKSYLEIHRILKLTDPDYTTPVFRGSTERITDTGALVESPACDNLINTVHESDETVYVLAIGAITNVASALLKDPSIKENMVVIWLGAHQLDFPDIFEFNLRQDHRAAQYLINSGVPLLLCPAYYVTSDLQADIETVRSLRGFNPLCDYLSQITEECYVQEGKPENWTRIIWDIAAPSILVCPECAEVEIIPAPVFADNRKYAFDSTRHPIILLKKLDRDMVFEKVWEILKNARR